MSARSTKQRRAARRRKLEVALEAVVDEMLLAQLRPYQRAFVRMLLEDPRRAVISWGRRGPVIDLR